MGEADRGRSDGVEDIGTVGGGGLELEGGSNWGLEFSIMLFG